SAKEGAAINVHRMATSKRMTASLWATSARRQTACCSGPAIHCIRLRRYPWRRVAGHDWPNAIIRVLRGSSIMSELAEFALRAVAIGVGATVVMDLWAVLLQRVFGVQPSNWAMVGRWVGHFTNGQFVHEKIADAPPIRAELALG